MSSKLVIKKLDAVLKMNNAFVKALEDHSLRLTIPSSRSNSIGGQFACIAGARDAYAKSIMKDIPFSWEPNFKYDDRYSVSKILDHLFHRTDDLRQFFATCDTLSDNQLDLVLDLMGHEFLHQGQLIRYMYANEITIPCEVKDFWHLED